MKEVHITIFSDLPEPAAHLHALLTSAGYSAVIPQDYTTPSHSDVLLVDVTQLRGSPLLGLQAQRRLGSSAPAFLIAPRLTSEMAEELFPLGIRGFATKPIDDASLLARLREFIHDSLRMQDEAAMRRELEAAETLLIRRIDEMNALSRVGRAITSLPDVDAALARMAEGAVYLAHADEAVIFLQDDSGQLLLHAWHGIETDQAAAIQVPAPDSDVMAARMTGQPVVRGSDSPGARITSRYTVRSAVYVPIMVSRQAVGVLGIHCHAPTPFDAADLAILNSLADYIAIALDRASLVAQAEDRVALALRAPRAVRVHAETLFDPIDGIESQADTLLSGGFEPLNEAQHTAVMRIKQAADRLKEIAGFIREALAEFER
jgi:putative methionine-R-sulfoxide reductase with GAF domain